MILCSTALLVALTGISRYEAIEAVSLPVIPEIRRADIYVFKPTEHPRAVLVLSPGFNGNGKEWIEDPVWQDFAKNNNLGLIALSFASDGDLLRKGHGYYYPEQGSGQLLLDGIDHLFLPGLPLFLYGFSGGAHFTSGFEEWKPQRVAGWCAYSGDWWPKPSLRHTAPPGLVICGNDDERLGASLLYFKQGRALRKPWLWMSIPENGHSNSLLAEDFVRHYFVAILNAKTSTATGEWIDIDLRDKATPDTLSRQPSLTGWLPDSRLLPEWKALHQP